MALRMYKVELIRVYEMDRGYVDVFAESTQHALEQAREVATDNWDEVFGDAPSPIYAVTSVKMEEN